MISPSKKTITQFIKFCIIGIFNSVVHLGIYYLLVWFTVYYLIANIVAFVFSVLNSYVWNKKFTFTEGTTNPFRIVRLYASYGITTLIGTGILFFLVDIVGLNKYISPVINIGITTSINFLLNKYFVFRDRG